MGTQWEQDDDTKGIWNGGMSPMRRAPRADELQVHIEILTEEMENLRSENRRLQEKALKFRLRAEKAEARLLRKGFKLGETEYEFRNNR